MIRNGISLGVGLFAAAWLMAGCDETRLHKVTQHYDLFFPEGEVQKDTFTQKAAAMIDILWVVDNSPSMAQEQNNLANNFDSFIGIIESSNVDYQIAVISTDMDQASHKGQFLGNPKIIQRGPDAKAQFQANIRVGTTGAGNEQGLMAAWTALTEPLISGVNAGFLRPGASLAVIFVSDEDDHSFNKISFYQRFFEQQKGVGNENRVVSGAIVGDEPDGCQNPQTGAAVVGRRYHELVQQVGGSIGSICAADWSATLNQLGLTVAGLDRRFTLSDPQPEDSTINVKVNGTPVPRDYQNGWTFENGSVFFAGGYVPPPGATIEVSYLHPQKEFTLTQIPAYDPNNPGADIHVTVYAPTSAQCTKTSDCTRECGLAGRCDGMAINYDYTSGWVLETPSVGSETRYVVSFEGNYYPLGGSVIQVVYSCAGGCKFNP